MPANSPIDYVSFATRCRNQWRYIPDLECSRFLSHVAETIGERSLSLIPLQTYFRAQYGCTVDGTIMTPFAPERMKPLPRAAREGRANPKGIPMLYLATDYLTAVSEIRPHGGAHISIASFRLTRVARVVDCTKSHQYKEAARNAIFPPNETEKIWVDIDDAFSQPIQLTDTSADYAPTQVLAEHLKRIGFDGIKYTSSLGRGKNIVLFDCTLADVSHTELVEVARVDYLLKNEPTDLRWMLYDSADTR